MIGHSVEPAQAGPVFPFCARNGRRRALAAFFMGSSLFALAFSSSHIALAAGLIDTSDSLSGRVKGPDAAASDIVWTSLDPDQGRRQPTGVSRIEIVEGPTSSDHRHSAETLSWRDDYTLRKGDTIMTPEGFMVFNGGQTPYSRSDFSTLSEASMPSDKRAILVAIERATLPSLDQSRKMFLPPDRTRFAFATPTIERTTKDAASRSIYFIERKTSTSN